ncbi:MAG: Flp pilus assembly complex ATPase component TadA [Firmicutes bacterium]|nr:Flp pilus assembly complex ATPase component TadA [Bacillota bacterium]
MPQSIYGVIDRLLNEDKLYEIRLRSGGVVSCNYGGKYSFLGASGLVDCPNLAFDCNQGLLQSVIMQACDHSIYASTKQINNGYVSVQGGIRIGVSGEVVWDGSKIRAIKNFSAINIRVPHEVVDCALSGFNHIYTNKKILNTLIISPPGAGKTTYLRDLARLFGLVRPIVNTLLVDERSEIAACYSGVPQLQVGASTDIISNCTKAYAFEQGIRAMRPDLIITDEIATIEDIKAIAYAQSAGVKVIASIHAYDIHDLTHKVGFGLILDNKVFDKYIVLSNINRVGTVVDII